MSPEEYIPIQVEESLLKKYFDFKGIPANKGKYSIKRKYYDQVACLLSEYGIQDQQLIDNLCFLEMIFWGQRKSAIAEDSNNSEKVWIEYYSDFSRFYSFLEEYKITGIQFQGTNKKKEAKSQTFRDPKFIELLMKDLSGMINRAKSHNEAGVFDSYKKRPGAEWKYSGYWLKETFNGLRVFLNDSPFPALNDFTAYEDNYFAGRLFTIAGIIEPYESEYKDRAGYKSEKDYLIQRMKKYW